MQTMSEWYLGEGERFQHTLLYQPYVTPYQLESWYGLYHPWQLSEGELKYRVEEIWQTTEQYAHSLSAACGIAWIAEYSFGVYFPAETESAVREWISNHPAVSRRYASGSGWVVEVQPRYVP